MSEPKAIVAGAVVWCDLTVADAEAIRDFYVQVTGWSPQPVSMGEYSDFTMRSADDADVAGICHARGPNAAIPPQWLIYVAVADLDASLRRCRDLGGRVVDGPRSMGSNRFCVIQDPAGAVAALIQG